MDWTVFCRRSTVRKAARFAVKVARIRATKNHKAVTRTREDSALGGSPVRNRLRLSSFSLLCPSYPLPEA